MQDKLKQVCEDFGIEGTYLSYEEITVGHVNRTYKVNYLGTDGRPCSYIAQVLNTFAFKNPVAVMENIDRVTEYIRKETPGSKVLRFFHTKDDKPYIFEGDYFWRLYSYVPAVTYNTCEDLDVIENAGRAFGEFQMQLAHFDPEQLNITIPNFHNTRDRYRKLEEDMAAAAQEMLDEVREELDWLLEVKETACTLTDLGQTGQLPSRVTHNDTKINNVLFAENGKEALVVVDLDTVMPGLVGFDFGDAIRFAANCQAEDCPEADKVKVNLDVFRAFTKGFLAYTAGVLTAKEVETLALSSFVMTTEVAVRFLNDYMIGSPYFKIAYPKHNLVRARCQIALAKDMLRHMDEMNAVVRECMKENS